MPFSRPDLATLIARAEADIETRLPGADARLRRSNLNVLARVHSGAAHGLYGYLDWISRQVIYDTAEFELLERWAGIWGIPRKAAAPAAGPVALTGTNGAVIPAGTRLVRSDGAEFLVDAEATVAGGTASVTVTADVAGQDGNTAAGSTLNLATPIAGVSAGATVSAGGLVGGADIESDDLLRARFLERIRKPPHGGAKHDYVAWALEVPGVTRAWVYEHEMGIGTVTVRFVRDGDSSLIPDAAEELAVFDHIDTQRQVGMKGLYVVAPVAVPIAFQIQLTPGTATVKAAVEAELRDLLLRESEPGATILLSHLREAVSLAAGETDHVLVSPVADITHTVGQMATFGSIAWL